MKHQYDNANVTQLYTELAMSKMLTVEEAIAQLKDEAYLRTPWETIRRFSRLDDMDDETLQTTLIDMLMAGNPGKKRDNVRRNVANWMNSRNDSIKRESALELSFALELMPQDANEMIVRLCGESFHRRSPRDIVIIYSLNNGLKFFEFNALLERLAKKGLVPVEDREEKREKKNKDGKKKPRANEETIQKLVEENVAKANAAMTSMISVNLEAFQTEEDLEQFLSEAGDNLGEMHNTAYTLFIEYMNLLKQPEPQKENDPKSKNKKHSEVKEDNMSVEDILNIYMFDKYLPKGKDKDKAIVRNALQKAIQCFWPDSATLSKMRTRTVDVTRKTMILLFLATDGGNSTYGDKSDETFEDYFQDMYIRLDSMLIDCGFAPLDARSPFDWMVLYCICSDDRLLIDENVRHFLQNVFSTSAEASEADDTDGE